VHATTLAEGEITYDDPFDDFNLFITNAVHTALAAASWDL